jgi:hypothetical protein
MKDLSSYMLQFELMDMANCGSAGRIRLADLMKCGVGGTVVSIMIDVHALMQNQTKD